MKVFGNLLIINYLWYCRSLRENLSLAIDENILNKEDKKGLLFKI